MKIRMDDPDIPVVSMDTTDESADWVKAAVGLRSVGYEEGMTLNEFVQTLVANGYDPEQFKTTHLYQAALEGTVNGPIPDWIGDL